MRIIKPEHVVHQHVCHYYMMHACMASCIQPMTTQAWGMGMLSWASTRQSKPDSFAWPWTMQGWQAECPGLSKPLTPVQVVLWEMVTTERPQRSKGFRPFRCLRL